MNYSNVLIRGNDPWLSEATNRNAAPPPYAVPVPVQKPNVMQKSLAEATSRDEVMLSWQQNSQRQPNSGGNCAAAGVWNQAPPPPNVQNVHSCHSNVQNVHSCHSNAAPLQVDYRNQLSAAGNQSIGLPCVISAQNGAFASNSAYQHQFYNIANSAMAKQPTIYDQKAPGASSSAAAALPVAVAFQAIPGTVADNGRFHVGNTLRIPAEAGGNHWLRNSYLSLPQSQIYYVPADSNDYYLVQPRNHPVFIIPSDMAQGRVPPAVQSHENAAKAKRKASSEQSITEAKKTCRSNS